MSTTLIIFTVIVLAGCGHLLWQNSRAPELGVSNGQLQPISNKPNNVSSQTDQDDKRVEPWPFKSSQEATLDAIIAAVNAYGGGTIVEQQADYLYVVFTSALMKYKDDVEFWLDSDNQQVHFRSSSRAGYSDMGVNRKRYQALRELFAAH